MQNTKNKPLNLNSSPIFRKGSSCTFDGLRADKKDNTASCVLNSAEITETRGPAKLFPRISEKGLNQPKAPKEQSLPKYKPKRIQRFKYIRSRFKKYQKMVHLVLEQPRSTLLGRLVFALLMSAIIYSTSEGIIISSEATYLNPIILLIDRVVSVIFVLELFLRIMSSTAFGGRIQKVFKNPIFLIDLIAIVPILIEIEYLQKNLINYKLITLCKTLTILKVIRYADNLSLLGQGIKKSISSLSFLLFAIVIATFVFGTLMYYVETLNPESKFNKGIPTTLWWTIVTMTTVGYGDMIPTTTPGKFIASIVGIIGMLMIALPLVILGYHFQEAYNEVEEEIMIEKVKGNQLQDKQNLDQKEKETFFLKRRIEGIEEYNKRITGLLTDSGNIYKNVSKDLKKLFKTMYVENEVKHLKREQSFKGKIELMEKLSRTKRKIKLIQIFKGGIGNPSKDELSPTLPPNNQRNKGSNLNLNRQELFNNNNLHAMNKDDESFGNSLFNSLSEFTNLENDLGDSNSFVGKVAKFPQKSGFNNQDEFVESRDLRDEPMRVYRSEDPKTKSEKDPSMRKFMFNYPLIGSDKDSRSPLYPENSLVGTGTGSLSSFSPSRISKN